MSNNVHVMPTIKVMTHYTRPNCFYCSATPKSFFSMYIPINDPNIKWELPKNPAPINLKIFDGYYILTICTICNHILND